jgi:ADP-ribose pyrophosphatase YjhB (NUDIX family)
MPSVGVFAAIFDERGRILCVRRNYPPFTWTTPGGGMENGESIHQAVEREVREETGYIVRVKRLLGSYSSTYKDDLVLSIEAEIVDRDQWQPDQEISELGFFAKDQLPQPMKSGTIVRILDAFDKDAGVMRVFDSD